MRQRSSRRKRKAVQASIAKDGEPPDPITATLVTAGIGAATAIATPFINKAVNKPPKTQQQLLPQQKMAAPLASPIAGESTTLTPGQKINGIYTSPQGVLSDAPTGRNTLLGG